MTKQKTKSQILKKRTKKNKKSIFKSIFKWMTILFVTCIVLSAVGLYGLYSYISHDLPKITSLNDYKPACVTSVYSDDGRKIGEFYKERRIVIPLSAMPDNLKNAFIAAEDSRFREHMGIDIVSILRAFVKNIKAGAIVQGGSTITQQVAKSFFLSPERTYKRKLKEAILAYRIDKRLTKDEILYLYLNQIYLGHGAYGVEAASENYFGKHAKNLNLAECSMLAGLPQAPSRYSPFKHPDLARQRQIYVLNRMRQDGYITNIEATNAINTVLNIKPRKNWFIEKVPCYTEYVRRYIEKKYGKKALYTEGLKIYTAVNIELQKIAREEVKKGLRALDRRQGYRGPLGHLSLSEMNNINKNLSNKNGQKQNKPGNKTSPPLINIFDQMKNTPLEQGKIYKGIVVAINDTTGQKTTLVRVGNALGIIPVKDIAWARKPDPKIAYWKKKITSPKQVFKIGDIIKVRAVKKDKPHGKWLFSLEQDPIAQAALLSIDAETGYVKAMIGGRDYRNSQFNRAIQSRRQPGSAFKPIIYAAALDKGYTAATVIIDSPVVFKDTKTNLVWKPHNYKEKFYGPTLFRNALVESRNVVTIKILQDIGIDYVINYARKLGITSDINRDLSISLGSSGVSLLELTNAYSVFSNLGYRIEPVFITKILDRNGNVLEQAELKRKKVIDMSTAYIMTNILESVIKSGTGWRVRALKRPVAGKTGTTNNLNDAWFIGYTPRYTTGVWVGFDNEKSLGKGETGSRAASPIWLGYMQKTLAGRPVRTFNVPEGIVFAKIDTKTGLLANESSKHTRFECFKEGTVPTQHTPEPGSSTTEPDELFKSGI